MKDKCQIIPCDFTNPDHCKAEIDLMREYMTDEMGGCEPLTDELNNKLIEGLKNATNALIFLAVYKNEFVGLTNSFINFATFSVKKFINIHDVIVKKEFRGKGIGEKLIHENIRYAADNGFSKVTLEVRNDNNKAQNLYKKLGFNDCNPPMFYWVKYI